MAVTEEIALAPERSIRWKQLWSLAALYASVIIGWIAYANYQPRLLVQFQFTAFTFPLAVAQGVILVVTPMIAGRLGDRYRKERGHRLPIITTGISFAAMVFMAVAFTVLSDPGEVLKWILPVLIVLWLVAMSVFTSPALSTVELFTPVDKLPHAMAVLTITSNVVYAVEPVIVDVIDYLGAPVTFMLGGVAVFLSGYALKRHSLGLFNAGEKELGASEVEANRSPYGYVFTMGFGVGSATMVLFYLIPDVVGPLFNSDGSLMVVGILLVSALMSWPVCGIVNRYGTDRVFKVSFCAVVLATLVIYSTHAPALQMLLLLIFALAYTFLSVASLPLAIQCSASKERVFCVGVFFSGVALPEGVWEAWLVTIGCWSLVSG